MTTTRKILGQTQTGAAADATLYTAPVGDAVVSTIVVCETNGVAGTFKICPRPSGSTTTTAATAIAWNMPIQPNETITFTIGLTLGSTQVIIVQGSTVNITFSAFGQENT